jgi:hypothetical protein
MAGPATQRLREIDPHEEVAGYLDAAWPEHLPWTHFPAGERRGDEIERSREDGTTYFFSPSGARLKRMGLKPGWLDFQFILPNGQFATAEMKRPDGRWSDDQKEHRRKLRALKIVVGEWFAAEDCERDITRWLAAFGLQPRCTLTVHRSQRDIERGPLL